MREIEFRGMGTDGKWHYGLLSISQGYSSQPKAGYYISNKAGCPWAYPVRPETIGQYTGLKDKNGKKIYEGDILTSTEYPFQDNGEYNYHAEVVYFDNCPCFGYIEHCVNPKKSGINNGMGESFEDNEQGDMFEVIGNIYENPELMEG